MAAGDLEEIAGPCSSTVNWCLCLRRALAVQPVSDLRGAGGMCAEAWHALCTGGWDV